MHKNRLGCYVENYAENGDVVWLPESLAWWAISSAECFVRAMSCSSRVDRLLPNAPHFALALADEQISIGQSEDNSNIK
mgnify:CR=1